MILECKYLDCNQVRFSRRARTWACKYCKDRNGFNVRTKYLSQSSLRKELGWEN